MARIAALVLALAGTALAGYDPLSVSGNWLVLGYQRLLSPLQGPSMCNFRPGCSEFTRTAMRTEGLLPGVVIGADRLMRCNPFAWAYYDRYYHGEILSGRLPDPLDNHVAWHSLADEPGVAIAALPASSSPLPAACPRLPDLAFADHLFADGEFAQAAGEYLRVRFTGASPGLRSYAGLMAGESYVQAGHLYQARKVFRDLESPSLAGFTGYGVSRTLFAEARYQEALAMLDSVISSFAAPASSLAGKSRALKAWTLFRQHRFQEGARACAASSDGPLLLDLGTLDGRDIRRRSRLLSSLLSAVVPGAGQLYSGRAGDGAYSFLTVAGTGLVTWWFATEPATRDRTRVKVSIFGALTALFYAGNVYGANIAARDFNRYQERVYLARADTLFSRLPLEPDYRPLLDSCADGTSSQSR